jgi:hypothetical protein
LVFASRISSFYLDEPFGFGSLSLIGNDLTEEVGVRFTHPVPSKQVMDTFSTAPAELISFNRVLDELDHSRRK